MALEGWRGCKEGELRDASRPRASHVLPSPQLSPGVFPGKVCGELLVGGEAPVSRSLSFLCLLEERVADRRRRRRHCPAGAAELELVALWCRRLRGRVRSATGGWRRRRRRRRPGWRVAPCRGDGGWLGAPGCSSIGLLGPSGHQSFFYYSREGLSTGVDRTRGTATRCGGSLPHPVCLRPGANPQAPRSFVCLLRESDCGAGSVPLFCARGLPREGVVGEALEGKNLACGGDTGGSRRVWDRPRRREKVREEGCNFPPSAGRCVTRSRGAFPPGSPIGADRLSCASQGLPGLPPRGSVAFITPAPHSL